MNIIKNLKLYYLNYLNIINIRNIIFKKYNLKIKWINWIFKWNILSVNSEFKVLKMNSMQWRKLPYLIAIDRQLQSISIFVKFVWPCCRLRVHVYSCEGYQRNKKKENETIIRVIDVGMAPK